MVTIDASQGEQPATLPSRLTECLVKLIILAIIALFAEFIYWLCASIFLEPRIGALCIQAVWLITVGTAMLCFWHPLQTANDRQHEPDAEAALRSRHASF